MAEPESDRQFHILMFPWFCSGHITPFFYLSNKLAERGFTISLLLPNKASKQFRYLNANPHRITLHPLHIPHVNGLPFGVETVSEISLNLTPLLSIALDRTRDQVEILINNIQPDFVIYDLAHWIPQITKPLGIKAIHYTVVCVASVSIVLVPARNIIKNELLQEEKLVEPPAGYPSSTLVLRGHEVRALLFVGEPFGESITFYERICTSMKESDALAIRTFPEIESKFCDYLGDQYGKPVLLTGPLLSEHKEELEDQWSYWLSAFEDESVIFCEFGMQINLELDQFQELLLGLELTGLPFLVALKPPIGASTVEEGMPEGFRDRVSGVGMVWGGWIEQKTILEHPSIGCYISHGGFGAIWEGLMSKCQLVMVPELGDQILNTRLLVEELKVGVEVKRDITGWYSKEHLCSVVKSVMDRDSEIGLMVKQNHSMWREMLEAHGFINACIDKFVQDIKALYTS
ncbi:UDP-glycosyltransferase 79B3-like [Euphorbia lathyris]|uniref:UDP-glycosyltransferase 79B3-like n=1 Tax=Euphorbia lathyris TaxID=212925 RepID=UPI0033134B26